MNIEKLFDNELYHNYGMFTTEDANILINYLKEEVMEYVAGLEKHIAELDLRLGCCRDASAGKDLLITELEATNKELMCAMREWYEDGFNRGDCGELIVKHGGEA